MRRKDFLKSTCFAAALGSLLGGSELLSSVQETGEAEKRDEAFRKFLHGWVTAMMDNMDKTLPEEERRKLMEENGRACAVRYGMTDLARSFKGNVDGFLAEVRKHGGETSALREGKTVRLTYEKCYCPLVNQLEAKLSPTYCLCTMGWTKAVYETLTGKPVGVKILSTIKRGDPKCLIEVDLDFA
jgi:hypothetical protein